MDSWNLNCGISIHVRVNFISIRKVISLASRHQGIKPLKYRLRATQREKPNDTISLIKFKRSNVSIVLCFHVLLCCYIFIVMQMDLERRSSRILWAQKNRKLYLKIAK